MIEGSTENVRTDSKDTVRLLLLLLVFAVTASSYVLREGMKESNKRSKYQLLIHCILIVTSVVPPELPMQMALAVNTSLMALMKMQVRRHVCSCGLAAEREPLMTHPPFSFLLGFELELRLTSAAHVRCPQIFCTEPYRVPVAGKVDVCLFDKTGTLTTDELVAVGVEPPRPSPAPSSGSAKISKAEGLRKVESEFGTATDTLVPMIEAPAAATLVLGGCQSLVLVDNAAAGDPVEAAAMKAIKVSH